MNFVFFSPHFPVNGADFCDRLKKAGARVLGIGDAPYDALDAKLKAALSEYYRVADMEDYDPVFRAMGHSSTNGAASTGSSRSTNTGWSWKPTSAPTSTFTAPSSIS